MARNGPLPVISVGLGGKEVRALVDTGCTGVVVREQLAGRVEGTSRMTAFDGRVVECRGTSWVDLTVVGAPVRVFATVVDSIVDGVDVVLGMDVINRLGGVTIRGGRVEFGEGRCALATGQKLEQDTSGAREGGSHCEIVDKDFTAVFDGSRWTVEWVWKGDQPPVLKNRIDCYDKKLTGRKKEEFDREVERWIDEGILLPWDGEVVGGLLPLMAVEQPTKHKVRPVLDYRELNKHIECHTGTEHTDVCSETLRKWRQMDGQLTLVDLKSAYLQVHVAKELWKYQLVRYQGRVYCLTRLGFGLNCAPKVMATILKTVLSKSKEVEAATDSYIDDILVDESKVSSGEVIDHLGRFGFVTKPPEPLEGGAALGLRVQRNSAGELTFSRGNELPEITDDLTRRELFSACGKLVGHYPVAGWLRVACSYVKRRASGTRWDDPVGDEAIAMIREVLGRVKCEDPVRGAWTVPSHGTAKGVVWCDSSSIAMGALLEIGGAAVEDAAWLRKKTDFSHINVAELEAVLKGVNLALKWELRDIEVMTDSATVHGWVSLTLNEERRIRTKGAAEMIVKRRLGVLRNLVDEFGLRVKISLVPTTRNKADILTRVSKKWLATGDDGPDKDEMVCASGVDLEALHGMAHVGVDRSLFLARKVDPAVTRQSMKRIVQGCGRCQSIDPAPVTHITGELGVDINWRRLAVDVTHHKQRIYLSIVDCGPGRFAIWRELTRETADRVVSHLNEVFLERGPVDELLMDNSTVFRSETMREFLGAWKVCARFRAAYRPSGNGIVERHHRTIKAMAERGNMSPMRAVFWYNMSPRTGQDERSVPQASVFRYAWRHPAVDPTPTLDEEADVAQVGEEVWVKPPHAKCTTHWGKGVVTRINSRNNVEIDGMPRHVLDIRRVVPPVTRANSREGGDERSRHDTQDSAVFRRVVVPRAAARGSEEVRVGALGGAGDGHLGPSEEGGGDVPQGDTGEGASGTPGEIPVGGSNEGVGNGPHGVMGEGAPAELGNDEPQCDVAGDNTVGGDGVGRPQRTRHPPAWLRDYETGNGEWDDE